MKVKKLPGKRVPPPPPEISKWIQELEGKDEEGIREILEPLIRISSLSPGLSSFPFPKSDLFHWVPLLDRLDASLVFLIEHYWSDNNGKMQKYHFQPEHKRYIISILGFFRLLLEQCSSRNIFSSYDSLKKLLVTLDWDVLELTLTLLLIPARKLDSQTSLRMTFETQIGTDELAILSRLSLPFIPNMKELPEARFASLFRDHYNKRIKELIIPQGDEGILVQQQQQYITLISTAIFLMAQPEGSLEDAYFTLSPTLIQDAVMVIEGGGGSAGGSSTSTTGNRLTRPMSPIRLAQLSPVIREKIEERRSLLEIASFSILRCCLRSETKWTEIESSLNLSSSHGPITSILRRIMDSIIMNKEIPFQPSFIYSYMDFLTTLTSQLEVDESFISSGGIVMELAKILKGSGEDGIMKEKYMKFNEKAFYILDLLLHEYPIALDVFFSGDGLNLLINQILLQSGGGGCGGGCGGGGILLHKQETTLYSRVIYQCLLRLLDKLLITNGSDDRFRNLIEGDLFSKSILPSMRMYLENGSNCISVEIFSHLLSITAIFIHNEPTSLSILQEIGLIDLMLSSLLSSSALPLNVELLTKLPMIFSAICLNEEGVISFKEKNPLPSLINVFLDSEWLSILRCSYGGQRNMASSILGTAIEEFIRHQPQFKTIVLCSIKDVLLKIPTTFSDNSKLLSLSIESMSTFLEPLLQNPLLGKEFLSLDGLPSLLGVIRNSLLPWDFSLHSASITFSHMLRVLVEIDCLPVMRGIVMEMNLIGREDSLGFLNLIQILRDLALNTQTLLLKEGGGGGLLFEFKDSDVSLLYEHLSKASCPIYFSNEEARSLIIEEGNKSLKGDLGKLFLEFLPLPPFLHADDGEVISIYSFEELFIKFRTKLLILEIFSLLSQIPREGDIVAPILFIPRNPPTKNTLKVDCLLFKTLAFDSSRSSINKIWIKSIDLKSILSFFHSNLTINSKAVISLYTDLITLRDPIIEDHIVESMIPLLQEGGIGLLNLLERYSSKPFQGKQDSYIIENFIEISSKFLEKTSPLEKETITCRLSIILRGLFRKDNSSLKEGKEPSWLSKGTNLIEEDLLIKFQLIAYYKGFVTFKEEEYLDFLISKKEKSSSYLLLISEIIFDPQVIIIRKETLSSLLEYGIERLSQKNIDADNHLTTLYLLISFLKRGGGGGSGGLSLKEDLIESLINGLVEGSIIPILTSDKSYRTIFTATICLIRLIVEGPILENIILEDFPINIFNTKSSGSTGFLLNDSLRCIVLRNLDIFVTSYNLKVDVNAKTLNANNKDNTSIIVIKQLITLIMQKYNNFPSSEGPEENLEDEKNPLMVGDHFSRCFILISLLELIQSYPSCRLYFLSKGGPLKMFLSFLLDKMTPSGELGGSLGSKLWVNESMWVSQVLEEITIPIKDDFLPTPLFPIPLKDRVFVVVEGVQQGLSRFISSLDVGENISSYKDMSRCWSLTMTIFVLLTSRDPRSIKSNPIQFWIASKMMEKGIFSSLSHILNLLDSEAPMASIVAGKIIHSLELLSRLASRLDKMLSGAISPNSMVREGIVEDLVAEYSGDSGDSGDSDPDSLSDSDSESGIDSHSDSDSDSDIDPDMNQNLNVIGGDNDGIQESEEDDMEDFLESLNVDGFEVDPNGDEDISDDDDLFNNSSYGGGIDEFGSDFDGDDDDDHSSSSEEGGPLQPALPYSSVVKAGILNQAIQTPEVHPLILGGSCFFDGGQTHTKDDPLWKINKDPYHSPYLPSTINRWTSLQALFKSESYLDESLLLERLILPSLKDDDDDNNDDKLPTNHTMVKNDDEMNDGMSDSDSSNDDDDDDTFDDISDLSHISDDDISNMSDISDNSSEPTTFIDNGPDKEFILALPFGMREEVLKQYFEERRDSIPNPLTNVTISPDFLRGLPQDFIEEYERLSQREIDHYRRRMADSGWMDEGGNSSFDDSDNSSLGEDYDHSLVNSSLMPSADINNIVLQIQDQLQQLQHIGPNSSSNITVTATLQEDPSNPRGDPIVVVTSPPSGSSIFGVNNTSQRLKPSQKEIKELLLLIPKGNYSTMINMKSLSHILLSYYDPVMFEKRTYMRLFEHLVMNQRIRPLFIKLLLHILSKGPTDLHEVKFCLQSYVESQTRQGRKRPLQDCSDINDPYSNPNNDNNTTYVIIQQRTLSILCILCQKNKDVSSFFKEFNNENGEDGEDNYSSPIISLFNQFSITSFAQIPLLVEAMLSLLKILDCSIKLPLSSIVSIIKVIVRGDIGKTSLDAAVKILTRLCEDSYNQSMVVCELTKEISHLITSTIGEIKVLKHSLSNPDAHNTDQVNSILKNISLSSSSQNRLERTIRILCKLVLQPKEVNEGSAPPLQTPSTSTPPSPLDSRCGTPMSSGNPITSVSPSPIDILKVNDYKVSTNDDHWILLLEELDSILLNNDDSSSENVAFGILPSIEAYFWHLRECLGSGGDLTSESSISLQVFAFAERHRSILNRMISHAPSLLTTGPFLILTRVPHLLDFANKRIWFKQQLHRNRRAEGKRAKLVLPIRRDHIFEDSFHALMSKSGPEVKEGKLEIKFRGEEGMDVGGVSREWFNLLSRKMFDPNNALFTISTIDKITYHPSKMSYCNPDHLQYFTFIGRIIGKAIYDGKILDCHFTRSFYKHIFQQPVDYKDMEALDLEYYKSLCWILENDITDVLDLTFSVEADEFGLEKIVDLCKDGRNLIVTEENKREYVRLIAEYKLTTEIRHQIDSFLRGFYEIIPCRLIAIFNEQELELLISGLPEIDVDDWRSNTEYTGYTIVHPVIQWFWRAVRSLDGEGKAKLLQFVTGTSKVPLDGFAGLQGSTGVQKFQIHRDFGLRTRLPSAHTCFNQLDLPEYENYEILKESLLKAIQECNTGFSLV